MVQGKDRRRRRGFTIRDLAVVVACLGMAAGMVASLAGANRDLSREAVCAANQQSLFGGLTAYVNTYNSYPPHNPYPPYYGWSSISTSEWDPNLGWILTYGLGLTPPATHDNGHFKWYLLNEDEVPAVVTCPAANRDLLFTTNPEIDPYGGLESFVFQYAAFFQTGGTFRAATPVVRTGSPSWGGRNDTVPDPRFGTTSGRIAANANGGVPYVWVYQKTGDPADPAAYGNEVQCWVQAVHPAEVQDPGLAYYLADTREYRPQPGAWPPAANNDGWLNGWGNKIYLGTRHYGYANVLYLDGRVSRDNQVHVPQWNMNYDAATGQALSDQWRAATFATDIPVAHVNTQVHIMPVLMVRGWEHFFDSDGVAVK